MYPLNERYRLLHRIQVAIVSSLRLNPFNATHILSQINSINFMDLELGDSQKRNHNPLKSVNSTYKRVIGYYSLVIITFILAKIKKIIDSLHPRLIDFSCVNLKIWQPLGCFSEVISEVFEQRPANKPYRKRGARGCRVVLLRLWPSALVLFLFIIHCAKQRTTNNPTSRQPYYDKLD